MEKHFKIKYKKNSLFLYFISTFIINRRSLLLFIFVIFYGRIFIVQVLTALLFREN